MKYSGLLILLADDMVLRSGPDFFPVLSFLSAALVNFFIPSGGGQWAIQGPIMMEAALKMGLDVPKMIMAFAYGDQVTNMLQPFWALPLLSITGIPAKEIFKYTFYFFVVGLLVYGLGVWIYVS
jgi:short-chain fatty acids transporter